MSLTCSSSFLIWPSFRCRKARCQICGQQVLLSVSLGIHRRSRQEDQAWQVPNLHWRDLKALTYLSRAILRSALRCRQLSFSAFLGIGDTVVVAAALAWAVAHNGGAGNSWIDVVRRSGGTCRLGSMNTDAYRMLVTGSGSVVRFIDMVQKMLAEVCPFISASSAIITRLGTRGR